ncbi:MAG: hypothetical protein KGJ88_10740, partial [Verrucomicrobiota bacterium]|nr:hypothetical protein [Verrucomicrobiota bacterium]
GTNFIFSGTNGTPGAAYYVLDSTNISLALTNWTTIATNNFDSFGNFRFTNSADTHSPQTFYMLKLQ